MKVKDVIKCLDNNGRKQVYNIRTRKYEHNQDCWDNEVKSVTFHKGYGYKQINAVIRIWK